MADQAKLAAWEAELRDRESKLKFERDSFDKDVKSQFQDLDVRKKQFSDEMRLKKSELLIEKDDLDLQKHNFAKDRDSYEAEVTREKDNLDRLTENLEKRANILSTTIDTIGAGDTDKRKKTLWQTHYLPTFNGLESPIHYITRMDTLVRADGLSTKDRIICHELGFTNLALAWFQELPDDEKNLDWDDFKKLMLDKFKDKQTDYIKEAQLMTLKFDRSKMTADEYLEKKLDLGRQLGKKESDLLASYLAGLPTEIFKFCSPRAQGLQELHASVKLWLDKIDPVNNSTVNQIQQQLEEQKEKLNIKEDVSYICQVLDRMRTRQKESVEEIQNIKSQMDYSNNQRGRYRNRGRGRQNFNNSNSPAYRTNFRSSSQSPVRQYVDESTGQPVERPWYGNRSPSPNRWNRNRSNSPNPYRNNWSNNNRGRYQRRNFRNYRGRGRSNYGGPW